MPIFPHEELPLQQLSLQNFVATAQDCQDDVVPLMNLMLCGRHGVMSDEGKFITHSRVAINARMGASVPGPNDVVVTRDYDSAMGITRNLPFKKTLAMFPVSPFRETLKTNNHMTYDIPLPTVSVSFSMYGKNHAKDCHPRMCVRDEQNPTKMMNVPLFRIPNTALGKVDNRQVTRIFFPKMYRHGESPAITQERLASLYNDHIRPAVLTALTAWQLQWPIAYDAAYQQYQNRNGELQVGTIDIYPDALVPFCEALLESFVGHEDFDEAFFLHELRGTKGRVPHAPEDVQEHEEALNDVMDCLDSQRINPEEWQIDVGLEISHSDHIVQWLTNGHLALLQHVLPSITGQEAKKLSDSSYFSADRVGHLRDFAGFHVHPHSRGLSDGVMYINVYCNEKTVIYQLHDGIYSTHYHSKLMPQKIAALSQNLVNMSKTFSKCSGVLNDRHQEASARLEVRVSLSMAMDVNVEFPEELLQSCVVSVTPLEWW